MVNYGTEFPVCSETAWMLSNFTFNPLFCGLNSGSWYLKQTAVRLNCFCWVIVDLTEKLNKTVCCTVICKRFMWICRHVEFMFSGGKPSRHRQGPNIFKKTDVKHFTDRLSHDLFVCKKKMQTLLFHMTARLWAPVMQWPGMAIHHGTKAMRNKISMLIYQSFFLQRFKLIYLFFNLYLFFCSSSIHSVVSEIPPPPINKPSC